MSKLLSFRNFLLQEEESFFTGMSKIGINKDDYKKFPQYASFFSLGKTPVNFGSYSILDYKKNENGEITHVVVKQIKDPQFNNLKYDKDNRELKDEEEGSEVFVVPIGDLEELLTQGQQAAAPGGGGDMGGIV